MLSLIRASTGFLRNTLKPLHPTHIDRSNLVCKRWSGHNAMNIEPSTFDYKMAKNWVHFYLVGFLTPVLIIWGYMGIRANPELAEIPEGYQPHHWEYFRHPLTRWLAKHWQLPNDFEYEMFLGSMEQQSENMILRKLEVEIKKVISFHNDYRGFNFIPSFYGQRTRIGRDSSLHLFANINKADNLAYESAFDPDTNPVPTEGYPPTD